ncbi:Heat Shock Protein [Aphelenchoides avenae]|nr:Heat Shock Protein [Aphelenchus avenae]
MEERPMDSIRIEEHSFGQARVNDDGDLQWKCTLHSYRPDGLNVELEGDHLTVIGHEKDPGGSYLRQHVTRRVILPEGIDKESIRCFIDEHGHVSIEAIRPLSKGQRRRSIPVEFRRHTSICEER